MRSTPFSASNALLFRHLALQPWCLTLSYLAFSQGFLLLSMSPCYLLYNILCNFSLDLFQSFLWLCDITMKNCFPFFVVFVSLYFSIAHTYLFSRPLSSEPPPTNSLEVRQAPGVIATSDFLRRGYQACKYQM